jgi:glutamate carboxypeptidase
MRKISRSCNKLRNISFERLKHAQISGYVGRASDFTELEATLQQRVKTQRIDAKVQLRFEMRRPPLEATPASRRLSAHGTAIYEELGCH